VVTTHLTLLLYSWMSLFYLYVLSQVFAGSKAVQDAAGEDLASLVQWGVYYGPLLPLFAPFFVHLRHWGLERRNMHKAAAAFSIRSTVCFVEEDRQVVQRNVVSFMRDFGFVSHFTTEDEALDRFDQIARKLVPLHLDASFGVGIPFWQVEAMMLPWCGWCADAISANLSQGFSARWYMSEVVYFNGLGLAFFPAWMALCMYLTSRCPGLSWVCALPFVAAVSVACLSLAAGFNMFWTLLYDLSVESWGAFAAYVLATMALLLLDAFIYRPRRVPAGASESCKVSPPALLFTADIRHDVL